MDLAEIRWHCSVSSQIVETEQFAFPINSSNFPFLCIYLYFVLCKPKKKMKKKDHIVNKPIRHLWPQRAKWGYGWPLWDLQQSGSIRSGPGWDRGINRWQSSGGQHRWGARVPVLALVTNEHECQNGPSLCRQVGLLVQVWLCSSPSC